MTLQPRIEELKKLHEKSEALTNEVNLPNPAYREFVVALVRAFPAIVEALEQQAADLASAQKFIVNHHENKFYGDHACAECRPASEMIVPGFVCAYHKAIRALPAPPTTKASAT